MFKSAITKFKLWWIAKTLDPRFMRWSVRIIVFWESIKKSAEVRRKR